MKSAQPGVPYVPKKGGNEGGNNEFLVGYAPGAARRRAARQARPN